MATPTPGIPHQQSTNNDASPAPFLERHSTPIYVALVVIMLIGAALAAVGVTHLAGVHIPRLDQLAAILMLGCGGGAGLISFVIATILVIHQTCFSKPSTTQNQDPEQTPTAEPPPQVNPTLTLPQQQNQPTQPAQPTGQPALPATAQTTTPPQPLPKAVNLTPQIQNLPQTQPTPAPVTIPTLQPTKATTGAFGANPFANDTLPTPQKAVVTSPKPQFTGPTNLPKQMIWQSHNLDHLKLPDSETKKILAARQPLMQLLHTYFQLDGWGYIIGVINEDTLWQIKESQFAQSFYQVARNGDVGYAEDIRCRLQGLGITSTQVEKGSGKPTSATTRPVSFDAKKAPTHPAEPPQYGKKNKAAYIDLFGREIWRGYKDFRHNDLPKKGASSKVNDSHYTNYQIIDYEVRKARAQELHTQGLLVGRVANLAEVADFAGNRYAMGNDILSTTLWPAKNAHTQIKLFCESNDAPVGVALDLGRTPVSNFGIGDYKNAFTVGTGFGNLKAKYKGDAAICLEAQHGLMQQLDARAKQGLAINHLTPKLSDDYKSYTLPASDARGGEAQTPQFTRRGMAAQPQAAKGQEKYQISHNEQALYRGCERDIFLALFVKSDSDHIFPSLKDCIKIQDHYRRVRGIYVPIFQFKGESNQLEEIVPDELLITLLGVQDVIPRPHAQSQLSQALASAGIDIALAKTFSQYIEKLPGGQLRSLFELQLLMFNLKNLGGTISILKGQGKFHVFDQIRLLDNLHLVFPTIHKTQSKVAKKKKLYIQDYSAYATQHTILHPFFQKAVAFNLKRFLGISFDPNTQKVTFDKATLAVFDQKDPKKTDFAKVLARAMQAAVLFNIYGDDTQRIVTSIVAEVRTQYPYLGISPANIDMILGSHEMQEILTTVKQPPFKLGNFQPQVKLQTESPFPKRPDSVNALSNMNLFGSADEMKQTFQDSFIDMKIYLHELGIIIASDGKVKIDRNKIEALRGSDEHLFHYEKEMQQIITMISVVSPDSAQNIDQALKGQFPVFGVGANGRPLQDIKNTGSGWIQQKLSNARPMTEFPFKLKQTATEEKEVSEADIQMKGFELLEKSGKVSRWVPPELMEEAKQLLTKGGEMLKFEPSKLKEAAKSQALHTIPKWDQKQADYAKRVGLMGASGKPLWEVEPEFHGGDRGKPKAPYLEVEDILGENVVELFTGPALDPATLQNDQNTFECDIDWTLLAQLYPGISLQEAAERHLVYTLLMSVDGDRQILRTNGGHYSNAVSPPMGGNIDYNPGNEKFRFRDDTKRTYFKDRGGRGNGYGGMGGYTAAQLNEVKQYDDMLLSNDERLLKPWLMLPSAYLTVTAMGMGDDRYSLDQAHKVLLFGTMGPQFEMYDEPEFANSKGEKVSRELDVPVYIIKPGAARNTAPLFPQFYQNGFIPGHQEIAASSAAPIGRDFDKPYAQLTDGAYLNRQAYQKSRDDYLDLVMGKVNKRLGNEAFYLKATLFGGGFFADTKKAGDLRPEVTYSMVKSYSNLLRAGKIPAGSVIEFPRYGSIDDLPQSLIDELKANAKNSGVRLVWSEKGDLFNFGRQKTLDGQEIDPTVFEKAGRFVVFGAGDGMSWFGNEKKSASVEPMIGNNTNGRLVFNWALNPQVFKKIEEARQNFEKGQT